MPQNKSIIIAGNFILDDIYFINSLPNESQLETINKSIFSPGGSAFNICCNLKFYKAPFKFIATGCIGNDWRGKKILDLLNKNKIDPKHIKLINKSSTSFTNVYLSNKTKERTFFHYHGSNDYFKSNTLNNSLLNSNDIKIIHIGYIGLLRGLDKKKIHSLEMEKLFKKIKNKNIEISVDTITLSNYNQYKNYIPLLKYVDHLVINEKEAFMISKMKFNEKLTLENLKKCCKTIANYGIRKNIIIHNNKYLIWYDGLEFFYKKIKTIGKKYIVNTSGAGDAFLTGVLWGLNMNWSKKKTLNFSHKLALDNIKSLHSCKFYE